MNLEEKLDLIRRGTEEVVTEGELKEILSEKENPTVYCGYEISGPVHLGTMTTLVKLRDYQKAGLNIKMLLADIHTHLNLKGEKEWINKMAKYWEETFKAFGLTEVEYILGSSYQTKDEYLRELLELSTKITINRGERSMRQVSRGGKTKKISQLIYPLMQALDIPYLEADLAHGGIDQRKVHMLAREHLPDIGYKSPTSIHNPMLISLQGSETKMSSSKPKTTFPLHADSETIKNRINKAYCPQGEVEGNPIIEIIKIAVMPMQGELKIERPEKYGGDVTYKSIKDLKKDFESEELHPADLKKATGKAVVEMLEPIREHFEENPEYLEPLEKL
ncbi:MAG: tyrosine--tRNA ligase [archaeon]